MKVATISCPWCLWGMGAVGASTKTQLDEAAQDALVEHVRHDHTEELKGARAVLLEHLALRLRMK